MLYQECSYLFWGRGLTRRLLCNYCLEVLFYFIKKSLKIRCSWCTNFTLSPQTLIQWQRKKRDHLSFLLPPFSIFFYPSTLWIPQMHQLHVPELSLLLLSKMNLIAWTTISVKAKGLKKTWLAKKKSNQSCNSVDQFKFQILFKHALRLILIIYNSLLNRLTVSRIYFDVTNQANKWKKSLLN